VNFLPGTDLAPIGVKIYMMVVISVISTYGYIGPGQGFSFLEAVLDTPGDPKNITFWPSKKRISRKR